MEAKSFCETSVVFINLCGIVSKKTESLSEFVRAENRGLACGRPDTVASTAVESQSSWLMLKQAQQQ
jgi:hypothetical protein